MKPSFLVAPLMLLACTAPGAHDVEITHAWTQPFDRTGKSAAVYMTITARCSTPDTLLSVRAKAPQQASLHRSSVSGDTLRMTPVRSVAVPCAKQTLLRPMGYHVFVTGIAKPLGIGDRIPLTLSFERAGEVEVVAEATTLALMEDVDPMHMHMGTAKRGAMDHMTMH